MIQETFDNKTKPLIEPENFYGKREKICDVCVITFSYKVMEWALSALQCEQVAEMVSCNGPRPIYVTHWQGKKIAFYMTFVTSAGAGGCLEDVHCLTGCTKYILFGSCGSLDSSLTDGKLIVPTHAYRDEGLSYHYVPAEDYIEIGHWKQVAAFFDKKQVPYVTGRTWSTDAIFRETAGKAQRLRDEGCITVEMECAGVQAVCAYRGLQFYNFLFTSDCLDKENWYNELLGSKQEWDMQIKCFALAMDLAALVCEENERKDER